MPSAGKTCAVCSHTAENPRLYRGHWYCVQTSRKGLTCYQLAKLKQQKQAISHNSCNPSSRLSTPSGTSTPESGKRNWSSPGPSPRTPQPQEKKSDKKTTPPSFRQARRGQGADVDGLRTQMSLMDSPTQGRIQRGRESSSDTSTALCSGSIV